MASRIWITDYHAAKFRSEDGSLLPIVRILIESAALQLIVELIVLALYAANANSQYIILAMITPIVVRFSLAVRLLESCLLDYQYTTLNEIAPPL